MISLKNLTLRFGGNTALDDVSADFAAPVSGLIGPNGAGKTTIMNVISGFLTPHGGTVAFVGADLLAMPPHQRTRWGLRRSFQREQIADDLTVRENVLALLDNLPLSLAAKKQSADRAIAFAGLEHLQQKPGGALTTLERRLTDVARCVAGHPKLVMFDEPAGGMSADESQKLGELIMAIPRETSAQVLVIDHDVDLIERICSETLVLDFGRRIAFGKTAMILADPKVQSAYLGIADEDAAHA
jgi:branched-chain amino acid transport system ATP-binding protein